MTPLVSVIVPTYNRPRQLRDALNSIQAQTCQDFEILVVNDGGEDVGGIVADFPKARYFSHTENRRLPAARNTALENATGKYIAYLDDDDQWYDFHLEKLLEVLQTGVRFAYSNANVQYPNEMEYLWFSREPGEILERNVAAVCCVMHERALIDEVGPFDESLLNHEDWSLWIRMSKVTPFYHLPEATALVIRLGETMNWNFEAMLKGRELVYNRYHRSQPC